MLTMTEKKATLAGGEPGGVFRGVEYTPIFATKMLQARRLYEEEFSRILYRLISNGFSKDAAMVIFKDAMKKAPASSLRTLEMFDALASHQLVLKHIINGSGGAVE